MVAFWTAPSPGIWALVESRRIASGRRQQIVAYLRDVSTELQKGAPDAVSERPRQGDLFDRPTPEFVEIDIKRVTVEQARSFGCCLARHSHL